MADEDIEQTLVVIKQCFVYKIPPRTSSHGYRAADWDLQSPMWTGRCVVVSEGDRCKVKLEDVNTGELFAACLVTEASIEPVADSSRYYVIKIDDGSGRHAFIGMGYTERSDAFDFSAALQDHARYVKQKKESEDYTKKAASQPKQDYSLPQGAKIHVELKNKKPQSVSSPASTGGDFGGLLPPPPSSSRSKSNPVFQSPKSSAQSQADPFFSDSFQFPQNQQNQQPSFQPQQPSFQPQQPSFQPQQFQFQPQSQQQFPPQQSNDIWGDFTGSTSSSSNNKSQNNMNEFGFL